MKKVTIIVPTYKKFDNLENNLISIFTQTYPSIELIITDDGSKNYDEKLIRELVNKLKDKRKDIKIILIHHPENLGSVRNINEAIKISTGDFIFPLAQDDQFYDEKVIENIVGQFKGNICTTYRECVLENGEVFEVLPEKKRIVKLNSKENYLDLLVNGNYISGACTYYRRKIFEKYGFFDENMKLLEDYPYYLILLKNKEPINFIPIKAIKYNYGGISTSKIINTTLLKDFQNAFKREKKAIENCKYIKRILEYNVRNIESTLNKKQKIQLYFKYFDITFIKIVKKVFGINIYDILINIGIIHE